MLIRLIQKKMTNKCDHLLRMLSALSISSSRVVFTDRLCGERSLSAAWPVILRHLQADGQVRRTASVTSCQVLRACSDNVYDANDRITAWGTSWGRGAAGRICHNGSPEHHTAAGCCGDRSNCSEYSSVRCCHITSSNHLAVCLTCDTLPPTALQTPDKMLAAVAIVWLIGGLLPKTHTHTQSARCSEAKQANQLLSLRSRITKVTKKLTESKEGR